MMQYAIALFYMAYEIDILYFVDISLACRELDICNTTVL